MYKIEMGGGPNSYTRTDFKIYCFFLERRISKFVVLIFSKVKFLR